MKSSQPWLALWPTTEEKVTNMNAGPKVTPSKPAQSPQVPPPPKPAIPPGTWKPVAPVNPTKPPAPRPNPRQG
jgi:hypothetical protein